MDNLIGKKFGQLTVEALEKKKTNNRRWWSCRCVCGKITIAPTAKLNNGDKTSCGCMQKQRIRSLCYTGTKHPHWSGHESISGSVWHRMKASAKRRGIPFEISIDYAWQLFSLQKSRCALSGELIEFATSCADLKMGKNTASLDRIDSQKGYVEGNVQWVHVKVNYMKQSMSQQEFLSWCKKIEAKSSTN